MSFSSIRLITNDVDRLVRFYELVTGTTATRLAPVFAEFRNGDVALAVADVATVAMLGDDAPRPSSGGPAIVEFAVDDVDQEFDRLRDSLTDVVLEPTTMPWGNRSTLFRDPDGTLVNLFSRPAAP